MVQPINYRLDIPDPFAALTQGLNVGLQMEQAQAAIQQRRAQASELQAQVEAARRKAEQDAAKATEVQGLQQIPLEEMTQPQRLRLMELTQSEATRAYMARAYESQSAEQRSNLARGYGGTILALTLNPEVGVQRLRTQAEAEKDPAQKKALEDAVKMAEINPIFAAQMIDGTMSMSGPEYAKVSESARNYLKNAGRPLYPEQERPIVVGRESSVFLPGSREFLQPPAPPAPPAAAVGGRGGVAAPAAEKPAKPGKAVKVVDPDTGKIVMVSEQEAIDRRMTPAEGLEGLSPKEIQRREATFPQAKQAVRSVTSTMGTIEETIDRLLKNQRGLNQATGFILGRESVPAVTDVARAAVADINQLRNLAFVQGLTELRQASTTGAGVGNVSNKEGDRFENLKASLDRVQSYDDLVAALRRLKSQATNTKSSVQTAFDDAYEYRQQVREPATAPGRAAPAVNLPQPPQAAVDALKQGRGTDAQFDAIFGPGAAARARGR